MEKSAKTKAMVAIFTASLLTQSANAIALVLQGMQQAYPGTTVIAAQMTMSVASLVGLVGMLAAGKAAQHMIKKNLLAICILLMVLGGLIGYFATFNLTMVYVAAGCVGLGAGGLIPLTSALIAEHFEGTKRATVMGAQSIFVNGGGVLIQLIGGFLAAIYWKNLFVLFIGFLLVDIVVFILLPKGKIERGEEGSEKPKVFSRYLAVMMFQGFFVGLCMMVFTSNVTMYIFELGIGNEAQAGLVTTAFAIGAVVIGVLIAFVMRLFGKYVFAAGLICGAAGLWLLAAANSLPLLVAGAVLIGFGFAMHNTSYFTITPGNTSPAATTMTMSLYTVAMNVGMIVCPLIITPVAGLFGESLSMCFVVGAVPVTIVAIIALFTPRLLNNYKLTLD